MNRGRVLNRIQMPPLLRHLVPDLQYTYIRSSRAEGDDRRGRFTKDIEFWDFGLDAGFNQFGRADDVATGRNVSSTHYET